MESSQTTFSTLPYDIICEICNFLENKDFLTLRLACKKQYFNIPKTRLSKLFSRRTMHFTDTETTRLTYLISDSSPETLSWTKHLTFDLANPYVSLVSRDSFERMAREYTPVFQSKIRALPTLSRQRELRDYQTRLEYEYGDCGISNLADYAPICGDPRIGFENAYRLLRRKLGHNTGPAKNQPLRSRSFFVRPGCEIARVPRFSRELFFGELSKALASFPNLKTIEFKSSETPSARADWERDEIPSFNFEIPREWQRHNQSLQSFISEAPELKDVPLSHWLVPSQSNMIAFDIACPAVLFCAAQAGCRISEIKVDKLPRVTRCDLGGSIMEFADIEINTKPPQRLTTFPCLGDRPRDKLYLRTNLPKYHYAFENLTRLEIWLHGLTIKPTAAQLAAYKIKRKDRPELESYDPSPFLDATLLNIKQLIIRETPQLSQRYRDAERLPLDLNLPSLQKIHTIHVNMNETVLLSIIRKNQSTLKELICTLSLDQKMVLSEVEAYLTHLKEQYDLNTCCIDFPNMRRWRVCDYTLVEIKGESMRDDKHCKYRTARLKEHYSVLLDERMRGAVRYWGEVDNWDAFIKGLEKYRPQEEEGW
ncbi:hypothetical protein TWF481_000087 [Arthrobotrys musiformis]|uniref:F-box domain-containing protein n=1 Tax=Arthrobotrys musiformis TaxID=47236 RepID=A0AAV9WN64_9PEZI